MYYTDNGGFILEPYRSYGRKMCSRPVNCDHMSNTPCIQPRKPVDTSKMRAPVGMAFVHMQEWSKLYDPDTALKNGTAFPDLNLIFCGVRGKK